MAPTRVQCFFDVPGARRVKSGMFHVWYIDVDISETDTKSEVRKAICIRTGVKFKSLKIRLGFFNELLAFDVERMGNAVLGSCGASRAVFEPKLLKAREYDSDLAKSVSELPGGDPAMYDGRYDWEQKMRPEWEA